MKKTHDRTGMFAIYDAILFFSIMMIGTSTLYYVSIQDINAKDWRYEKEMSEYVNYALTSILQTTMVIDEAGYRVPKPIIDILVIEIKDTIYGTEEINEIDNIKTLVTTSLRRNLNFILDVQAHCINKPEFDYSLIPPIISNKMTSEYLSRVDIDNLIIDLIENGDNLYVYSTSHITFDDAMNNRVFRMSISLWIWE